MRSLTSAPSKRIIIRWTLWRGDREAEGAALEMPCTETYRGFESRPLRSLPSRNQDVKPLGGLLFGKARDELFLLGTWDVFLIARRNHIAWASPKRRSIVAAILGSNRPGSNKRSTSPSIELAIGIPRNRLGS